MGAYHGYDEDQAVQRGVDESVGHDHREWLTPAVAADAVAHLVYCQIPIVCEEPIQCAEEHPSEQPLRRYFLLRDYT